MEDAFLGPGCHWFRVDEVGIAVAQDEEALVAVAGCCGETAGLVSKDLAGHWFGLNGCIAAVSAMVGWFQSWESKFIVVVVDWHGRTCFGISGGTLVLPGFVEVAFEHGA